MLLAFATVTGLAVAPVNDFFRGVTATGFFAPLAAAAAALAGDDLLVMERDVRRGAASMAEADGETMELEPKETEGMEGKVDDRDETVLPLLGDSSPAFRLTLGLRLGCFDRAWMGEEEDEEVR